MERRDRELVLYNEGQFVFGDHSGRGLCLAEDAAGVAAIVARPNLAEVSLVKMALVRIARPTKYLEVGRIIRAAVALAG